jgi:hypothetical protein
VLPAQVAKPKRQAIDQDDVKIVAARLDHARKSQGFLNGVPVLGARLLMMRDAYAHFVVVGTCGGDEDNAASRST